MLTYAQVIANLHRQEQKIIESYIKFFEDEQEILRILRDKLDEQLRSGSDGGSHKESGTDSESAGGSPELAPVSPAVSDGNVRRRIIDSIRY